MRTLGNIVLANISDMLGHIHFLFNYQKPIIAN